MQEINLQVGDLLVNRFGHVGYILTHQLDVGTQMMWCKLKWFPPENKFDAVYDREMYDSHIKDGIRSGVWTHIPAR